MIVYKPNKNFLGDLRHLTRSWTMVKLLRGVLLFGAVATVVAICGDYFKMSDMFAIDRGIFSFLGIVLSILLVFRTNTAYDRWWEGRIQWGALVNHCRNLAVQLHVTIPPGDVESRKYLSRRIANFCIAFKEHLRQGTRIEELIDLTENDHNAYASVAHVPNLISLEIQRKVEQLHRSEAITGFDHINIKTHTQALLDILGACERIKKTPIPFSYAVYIKLFIMVYCLLLPFSLFSDLGYSVIPITMFVSFAFLGIELMAGEIEEPFGLDCNDLPTGTIASTIRDNIFEIFDIPHEQHAEPVLYEKVF